MGRLLIALFSSPMQFQNANTAFNFAKAAIGQGHDVTIFFDLDAIYTLRTNQILPDEETPTSKLVKLIKEGVHVLACMESARLRGIDQEELIPGVEESSLAKFVELMEESDRVVTFKS